MSIPLVINGVTYVYPDNFDENWGVAATNWASAATTGMVQTSGGTMTGNLILSGNKSLILKDSEGTPKSLTLSVPSPLSASYTLTLPVNAGSNGQVLSTNGSGTTSWVNAAGGGTINSGTSGQLGYYATSGTAISGATVGSNLSLSGATLTLAANVTVASIASTTIHPSTGGVVRLANTESVAWRNAANSANITLAVDSSNRLTFGSQFLSNGNALSTSLAMVTDGAGIPTTAATTATQINYLASVTSDVQTQLDSITSSYLPRAGGSMTGAISMGSHKITALTPGTNSGEAIAYGQTNYATGSTANSGGMVGSIVQGTISTPDFRANAVTQVQNSASGSTSDGAHTITTKSITTQGGAVMVFASSSLTAGPGVTTTDALMAVTRGGTSITGALSRGNVPTAVGNALFGLSVVAVDTPTAGTYTYNLTYTSSGGTVTINSYSLVLVELKA